MLFYVGRIASDVMSDAIRTTSGNTTSTCDTMNGSADSVGSAMLYVDRRSNSELGTQETTTPRAASGACTVLYRWPSRASFKTHTPNVFSRPIAGNSSLSSQPCPKPKTMRSSNLATLTHSHRIVAAKRRAKKEQIKEIVFDDAARRYVLQGYDSVDIPDGGTREFLTGFHKRKLQKKEVAKKKALERERHERLEAKREVGLHPHMSDFADPHHTLIETTNACGKSCAERS